MKITIEFNDEEDPELLILHYKQMYDVISDLLLYLRNKIKYDQTGKNLDDYEEIQAFLHQTLGDEGIQHLF